MQAPSGFLRPYHISEYQPGLWTSGMGLSFVVQPTHVAEGDLELRCTSTVTLSHWDDSREIVVSDAPPQTEQQDPEGDKNLLASRFFYCTLKAEPLLDWFQTCDFLTTRQKESSNFDICG